MPIRLGGEAQAVEKVKCEIVELNAIKLGIGEKGSIREIRDRINRRDAAIVKAGKLV